MSKKAGWMFILIGSVILTLSIIGGIVAIWLTKHDAQRLGGSVLITGLVGWVLIGIGMNQEPWRKR